jgi:hypothetical protein
MRRRLLLLPLLAMLAPAAADACSIVIDHRPTRAEEQAGARRAVDGAAAIIDGEVIRPLVRGGAPALVRVHRLFKGPRQAEFEVGELTSCDIALMAVGERSRMILTGGPDVYFIRMGTVSERAVDRRLGSDRRRDWPYVRGAIPAP